MIKQCPKHHLSLSNTMSKRLSYSMMKWWALYTNLPVNATGRQPHPRSGDIQGQEMFLAPSADKKTGNYDKRVLKPPSFSINPKVNGIEP